MNEFDHLLIISFIINKNLEAKLREFPLRYHSLINPFTERGEVNHAKEDPKVFPLLVKTRHALVRLWLPCKEVAPKSVLWQSPAKEKQIQRGICQLQHFSWETKARCLLERQAKRACADTDHWPAGGENNCRPCAQITSLISLHLIVWERNGGVEFIVCQVFIWPTLEAKRTWGFT